METLGGRYEILSKFEGGMGYAYKVHDKLLDEVIVAKTFKQFPKLDEVFFREVSNWLRLPAHTNVIRALYALPIRDTPYLFLEYAELGSLAEVKDKSTVPQYLLDVCYGMDYIHKRGILHLDLKPNNVLLIKRNGHVRAAISDFGLSSLRDDQSNNPHRGGTLPYMAPERLAKQPILGISSDIYSFGVMCYQFVSGHLPFETDNIQEFIQMQKTLEPKPLTNSGNALEKCIGKIAIKCLKKESSERYSTFEQIANELADFIKPDLPTGILDEPSRYAVAFRELTAFYKQPTDEEKDYEEALFNVGVCYYNSGDYRRAFETFDRALQIGWSGEAVYYLASILAKVGRIDEALQLCQDVIQSPVYARRKGDESHAIRQAKILESKLLHIKGIGQLTEWDEFDEAREAAVKMLAEYYQIDESLFPKESISAFDRETLKEKPVTASGHKYHNCDMVIPGIPAGAFSLYILDSRIRQTPDGPIVKDIEGLKKHMEKSWAMVEQLTKAGLRTEKYLMYTVGDTYAVRITELRPFYRHALGRK